MAEKEQLYGVSKQLSQRYVTGISIIQVPSVILLLNHMAVAPPYLVARIRLHKLRQISHYLVEAETFPASGLIMKFGNSKRTCSVR